MFLLRAAFWLSVVIMFIPGDPHSDSPAPSVGVIETLVAARTVIADMSHFCERNPDVCVTGNAAFHVFAEKAQSGARMLYDYLDAPPHAGQSPAEDLPAEERGTLTGDDRLPLWQAPRDDESA